MNDETKLSNHDLQIVLNGLPPRMKGDEYFKFLDRLSAAGLRYDRPMMTKDAPKATSDK